MKPALQFLFILTLFTGAFASEKDLNAYVSLGFPIKPEIGIEINSFKWKFITLNNRLCYVFNQKATTRTLTFFNSNGDSIGTETEKWENKLGGISYSFIPKFNIKNMFFIGAGLSSEAYLMILKNEGFEGNYFLTWIADLEYIYKRVGFNFYCTQIPIDYAVFINNSYFEIGFGFSVNLIKTK
ncbi:MAG: hypothetical protein GXX85_07145 [Ignavibacteria bacterium]|nr:hypothetical protein [Ignavibacteria bacterium]